MKEITKNIESIDNRLFERVVDILEKARKNVVRSVNSNMVIAYWMIGKEIIEVIQSGDKRAEYGKKIIQNLSDNLNLKYGKGFSVTNLQYFRKFFLEYEDRFTIQHPPGVKSAGEKGHPSCGEFSLIQKQHPAGGELNQGFDPDLSWSHYRAIMRVKNKEARDFYELEASECGWSKTQLERQIQTSYFERILKNKGSKGLLPAERERLEGDKLSAVHILKSPYVLEFLGLPDSPVLHENDLENEIINNLQAFLLELGKGFSFVGRQQHIRFDDDDFYIDLVFYNYILKCFILIDLKIGKLTHKDVGQMDGYVRLFEDKYKNEGDNPTIGLILCSDKSEAVAKYSVLKEGKQIFASKYLKFLPSEEELKNEVQREVDMVREKMAKYGSGI